MYLFECCMSPWKQASSYLLHNIIEHFFSAISKLQQRDILCPPQQTTTRKGWHQKYQPYSSWTGSQGNKIFVWCLVLLISSDRKRKQVRRQDHEVDPDRAKLCWPCKVLKTQAENTIDKFIFTCMTSNGRFLQKIQIFLMIPDISAKIYSEVTLKSFFCEFFVFPFIHLKDFLQGVCCYLNSVFKLNFVSFLNRSF